MATPTRKQRTLARREFLKASGRASLGALALMVGGSAMLPKQLAVAQHVPDSIREIHLETREVTWELAPGKRIKAMAYNGQVPGPEIRAQEGERVRVVLTNALAEPTTRL
jgi:FtsP/CotA-like multicopper oxidase with cupredoxin domain